MKYVYIFVICISLIISMFGVQNYQAAITWVEENVSTIRTAARTIGLTLNVGNFREHPLVDINSNILGSYIDNQGNVRSVGSTLKTSFLPYWLYTNNGYENIYEADVTVSPFSYEVRFDSHIIPKDENYDSGILLTKWSISKVAYANYSIRFNIVIKRQSDGNLYEFEMYVTNAIPDVYNYTLYLVLPKDSPYGWVSGGFNDFNEFLTHLSTGSLKMINGDQDLSVKFKGNFQPNDPSDYGWASKNQYETDSKLVDVMKNFNLYYE